MIRVFNEVSEFLEVYQNVLLEDETRNNLIIGITMRGTNIESIVASEINGHYVIGVLAGKNMIITANTMEKEVYKELVLYMEEIEYPGIIGALEDCETYLEVYKEVTGKKMYVSMNQRIYQCDKVNNIGGDVGTIRLAKEEDVELLTNWLVEFGEAAQEKVSEEVAREGVLNKIELGKLYVLVVDGDVVSMTARTRLLINTETIGMVFTPQSLRGQGYATRLVDEVTRKIHQDGRIATLYTDLSNPTSNSIYMKIGYEPHCDSIMLNKKDD